MAQKHHIHPEHHTRSKRVWSLRQITGLSRREFAKRYGVAAGTLQNWEDPNGNGLSEKGAYRLIYSLQASGIYCNVEWLLHGVGEPPYVPESPATPPALALKNDESIDEHEQKVLKAELQLFCSHYAESIYLQVSDDCMHPLYRVGDFIGGVRAYHHDIGQCVGEDCIVLLSTGEQLLRRLRSSTIPGLYDLISINPNTNVPKPYHYDVNLIYAAPVIWSRRLNKPVEK